MSSIPETPQPFVRRWFVEQGFVGFLSFADLQPSDIPKTAGIYAVLREHDDVPTFLQVSTAGRHKGRDPTVTVEVLRSQWVHGAHCLYIGKADLTPNTNLRRRVMAYANQGRGKNAGHFGGRSLWQCADASDYIVCWKSMEGSPRAAEDELLKQFRGTYGQLPFANRTG